VIGFEVLRARIINRWREVSHAFRHFLNLFPPTHHKISADHQRIDHGGGKKHQIPWPPLDAVATTDMYQSQSSQLVVVSKQNKRKNEASI
jgi:hypothetical protein